MRPHPILVGLVAVLAVSATAPGAKAQSAADGICNAIRGDLRDFAIDYGLSTSSVSAWCRSFIDEFIEGLIPLAYGLRPASVHPSTVSATLDRNAPTATAEISTDWLNFSDADSSYSTTYRFQTECAGTICRETSPSGRVTTTDIRNARFSGRGIQWTPLGERGGIVLFKRESRGTQHGTSYDWEGWGGWTSDSVFFAQWREGVSGRYAGWGGTGSYSAGRASVGNPVAVSARWSGFMAGIDVGPASTRGNPILGRADIRFENRVRPTVDVAFTDVYDIRTLGQRADMSWNGLPVSNGSFHAGADSNSIQGRFYGTRHQEVGGVFERNQISGAFGATRR